MSGAANNRFCRAALNTAALFAFLSLQAAPLAATFDAQLRPLVADYCIGCHNAAKHKGDVILEGVTNEAVVLAHRDTWEKVLKNLQSRAIPPENKPQPGDEQRQAVAQWLEKKLYAVDCDHPDPGRVTLRRLNRSEYNNTIRDLLAVDNQPAEDFPADDVGYGFDNIGDVLSMPPILLEKYLAAAEQVLDAATIPALTNAIANGPRPTRANAAARAKVLVCDPAHTNDAACARLVLTRFATRAFRRPASSNEVSRLFAIYGAAKKEGDDFETALRLPLQAVLVSPHFLFRGEIAPEPNNPKSIRPVSDYALAARLSYFLWSSMPDDELFDLASRKQLRKRGVFEKQVKRMLADARSRALVENFSGQWLQIRSLARVSPDTNTFSAFSQDIRSDMERETQLFFECVMKEDRSVLDFIDGPYTFLNERLASYYGIADVKGEQFRKVSLAGAARGGVLTHGSVLTVTSNPSRTSPVKRGKWVLDNLLGTPPPPPPPNVPELKVGKELKGSLRERMEQHRADPNCASCHDRMDPIGFGLENFNGVGLWRDKDGVDRIDASGKLPGGRSFSGPAELRKILLGQKDLFARCLAEKMLTYALGRGLEYYDRCAVDKITGALRQNDYRFSVLITEIVNSAPFQMRRGDDAGARSE